MKAEKNIRVELVRMEGNVTPFVQVNYMDKDAQECTGLFLLDSGSNENILSSKVVDSMGSLCAIVDGDKTILSFTQEVVTTIQVSFPFALGGNQFHEIFCVRNMPLPLEEMTVIGILGNPFLQLHNLVIDFHGNTLHTSEITPSNFSILDCAFFFPMEMGLKFYGMPVLPTKQNGKELVTLVDTGANVNVIANQALKDNDFKYERLNGNIYYCCIVMKSPNFHAVNILKSCPTAFLRLTRASVTRMESSCLPLIFSWGSHLWQEKDGSLISVLS